MLVVACHQSSKRFQMFIENLQLLAQHNPSDALKARRSGERAFVHVVIVHISGHNAMQLQTFKLSRLAGAVDKVQSIADCFPNVVECCVFRRLR